MHIAGAQVDRGRDSVLFVDMGGGNAVCLHTEKENTAC